MTQQLTYIEAPRNAAAQPKLALSDLFDIFDITEDSIIIFDKDWRYVHLNNSGWQIVGRPKEEIIGQNVWELWPYLTKTQFAASAKDAMAKQQNTRIEEYYPHRQKYFRTRFYPTAKFLLVRITDITDLKQAQEINDKLMGELQPAMEVYWSDANQQYREAKGIELNPKTVALASNQKHQESEDLALELEYAKTRVTVGGRYSHYKNKSRHYKVTGLAFQESNDQLSVIYQAQYGERLTFTRPLVEWLDTVEWSGKTVPRFKEV